MGSYASVAVRDAAGNIVGYVSTSTGQVVETTGAGSSSFQQIQAQYAQQRYTSIGGAGAYQQSVQYQYLPETMQFSKDAAGIAAEVYLRTGGRGAVDFNLGMEAVRPAASGESKNTIDPRYVNIAGVNELGQRVNVNLVEYARGNAKVGGLSVIGIDTGVHTARGDWGPTVITSTEMQRQSEFIQAVQKKPFLSSVPSAPAQMQESTMIPPTGTFEKNVSFFGMLGLGGYEAGQRAFQNVTQGRHPAVDVAQAATTKNITGSKVLASVPAFSSLAPDSGTQLWLQEKSAVASRSPLDTRVSATGLTGFESQALIDVTKRPGYTEPSTLGDSKTRAITGALALMRGAGFNVASPDAALGKTLEFQRQRAAFTPGTKDEQYYSGELQKWAQNKVELASAYHAIGMKQEIPIAANRWEYAGDLAVEFLKGAPKKASEVFSPVSGEMGAVLSGGKGLQDVAWETARDPGAIGTSAPASVSFMPGVDLLAAAEKQYGPYGKLRGGDQSRDLTNRVLTQDRVLAAGNEAKMNLPPPFISNRPDLPLKQASGESKGSTVTSDVIPFSEYVPGLALDFGITKAAQAIPVILSAPINPAGVFAFGMESYNEVQNAGTRQGFLKIIQETQTGIGKPEQAYIFKSGEPLPTVVVRSSSAATIPDSVLAAFDVVNSMGGIEKTVDKYHTHPTTLPEVSIIPFIRNTQQLSIGGAADLTNSPSEGDIEHGKFYKYLYNELGVISKEAIFSFNPNKIATEGNLRSAREAEDAIFAYVEKESPLESILNPERQKREELNFITDTYRTAGVPLVDQTEIKKTASENLYLSAGPEVKSALPAPFISRSSEATVTQTSSLQKQSGEFFGVKIPFLDLFQPVEIITEKTTKQPDITKTEIAPNEFGGMTYNTTTTSGTTTSSVTTYGQTPFNTAIQNLMGGSPTEERKELFATVTPKLISVVPGLGGAGTYMELFKAAESGVKSVAPTQISEKVVFASGFVPGSPEWVRETYQTTYEDPTRALASASLPVILGGASLGLRSFGVGTTYLAPASKSGMLYQGASTVVTSVVGAAYVSDVSKRVLGFTPGELQTANFPKLSKEGEIIYPTTSFAQRAAESYPGLAESRKQINVVTTQELVPMALSYAASMTVADRVSDWITLRKTPEIPVGTIRQRAYLSEEGFPTNQRITTKDLQQSFEAGTITLQKPSQLAETVMAPFGKPIERIPTGTQIGVESGKRYVYSGAETPYLQAGGMIGESSSEVTQAAYVSPAGLAYFSKPGTGGMGAIGATSDILGIYRNPTLFRISVKEETPRTIPEPLLSASKGEIHTGINDPYNIRNIGISKFMAGKEAKYGKVYVGQYGKSEWQGLIRTGTSIKSAELTGWFESGGRRVRFVDVEVGGKAKGYEPRVKFEMEKYYAQIGPSSEISSRKTPATLGITSITNRATTSQKTTSISTSLTKSIISSKPTSGFRPSSISYGRSYPSTEIVPSSISYGKSSSSGISSPRYSSPSVSSLSSERITSRISSSKISSPFSSSRISNLTYPSSKSSSKSRSSSTQYSESTSKGGSTTSGGKYTYGSEGTSTRSGRTSRPTYETNFGGGGIPAGGSYVGPGYRGKYSKTYINPVGADILGATRGVPLKVPSRKKFKPPKFKMPKF